MKLGSHFSLIFGLSLALTPSCALADFQDGNKLLNYCNDKQSMLGQVLCMGYVEGIIDSYAHLAALRDFCIAPEVTSQQVTDVAVKWLNEHPQHRHLSGESLVRVALKEAFPCAAQ